jgi:hypothetical protein
VTEIIAGEPQYYRDANGEWWQADYATTTKEAFDAQTRPPLISGLFHIPSLLVVTPCAFHDGLESATRDPHGVSSASAT